MLKDQTPIDYTLFGLYLAFFFLTLIAVAINFTYLGHEALPLLLTLPLLISLYRNNLWLPTWWFKVSLVLATLVAIFWIWLISPNGGYYWLPFALAALFVPYKLSISGFLLIMLAFIIRNLQLNIDGNLILITAITFTGGFTAVLMVKRLIDGLKEEVRENNDKIASLQASFTEQMAQLNSQFSNKIKTLEEGFAAERAEFTRELEASQAKTTQLELENAQQERLPNMPVLEVRSKDNSLLIQHLVEGKKQNSCLKEEPQEGAEPSYYSEGHVSRMVKECLIHNNLIAKGHKGKKLLSDCLEYGMYDIIDDYN